jgi:anti-anti-sigma factor
MSTQCSHFASLNPDMDSMEPTLNIPVDLSAVGASPWDATREVDLPRQIPSKSQRKNPCTVVVNLPEQVTAKHARTLIRDLRDQLSVDQPCVILDLSDVKEMDTAGLDLLLECLHQTVRRDGIIQLRGISPEAATVLELTGMDQILGLVPGSASDSAFETAADYLPETLQSSQHSLVA